MLTKGAVLVNFHFLKYIIFMPFWGVSCLLETAFWVWGFGAEVGREWQGSHVPWTEIPSVCGKLLVDPSWLYCPLLIYLVILNFSNLVKCSKNWLTYFVLFIHKLARIYCCICFSEMWFPLFTLLAQSVTTATFGITASSSSFVSLVLCLLHREANIFL